MDNLGVLEEKVAAAIGALSRLRSENAALVDKLKKADAETRRLQSDLEKAQAVAVTNKKMEEELSTLRAERDTVKSRISAIVEKLAALDGDE